VRAYIRQRKQQNVSNGTINREIGLLSAVINYARSKWEWDIPNPVATRRLREPEGRVRWITRQEVLAVVRAAQMEP
jgi:hypothetical protein